MKFLFHFQSAKKGRKSFNFGKVHFPAMEDLQNSLELERKRNVKLTEQMERLRQENYSQAQECKIVLSDLFFFILYLPIHMIHGNCNWLCFKLN